MKAEFTPIEKDIIRKALLMFDKEFKKQLKPNSIFGERFIEVTSRDIFLKMDIPLDTLAEFEG